MGQPGEQSGTDAAKEQASGVAQNAKQGGEHVAGVAKDEARNVAGEANHQAKELWEQTRSELTEQAGTQQQRVAQSLRSLSDELGQMADRSDQSGMATDLARQASTHSGNMAQWLDQRDPGSLVEEVKSFARNKPGTFLAVAAGVGLLAGRFSRGAAAQKKQDNEASSGPSAGDTARYSSPATTSTPPADPVRDPLEPVMTPPTPLAEDYPGGPVMPGEPRRGGGVTP